jgi:DNA repair exonuclease SbcCD nuclease subunit
MKDKIVFVGDIHGEFGRLRWDIKTKYSNAHIIQVGDFGIGFYKPNHYKVELKELNETLERRNCHLYAIRGNHDNPEYFKDTHNPFDYKNITLLADYSELELLNRNMLLVGGAVSVDRGYREEGKNYWSDEEFVLKLEHEFPYRDRQYDFVVTHTRPGVCGAFKGFANIKHWCDQDYDLKNELIEESQKLDYLYEHTKPKRWYYGHFHESLGINYEDTHFRCLNIHEHHMIYE